MRRRRILSLVALAVAPCALPRRPGDGARAQGGGGGSGEAWPTRPVTIVSAYPPGASTDLVARALARRLGEVFGHPFVVENRPGGNGMLGTEGVASARPDGHILQVGHNATHGLIPLLARNPPYDPLRDFTTIALVASAPTALSVHPSVPARDLAGLLDWARANPDRLQVATSGNATHHHLGAEMLAQRSGLPFVHVPFRGGAEALTAVLGGHVPMVIGTLSTVLAPAREGRVRIIALVDAERTEAAPGLPTVAETLPGFAVPSLVLGLLGPAGMDPALVARLNAAANEAMATPEFRAVLAGGGMQPRTGPPEAFRRQLEEDLAAFRRITAAAGLRPE